MAGVLKGVGKLVGGIFGGGSVKQPSFDFFPNITTPAFRLKTAPGGAVNLTRLADTQRFPNILSNLADLRGEVRPGFGRFTEAAVDAIRRAKEDTLGNVRQQLQRRRVQGSSFANAQLAGIEAAFGRDEALVRGRALLQEIDQTFRIINQELKVKISNFQAEFVELGIAANVAGFVTEALSAQAVVDKEIAAKAAEGAGSAFGDFGGLLGSALEDFIGGSITKDLFGGGDGGSVTGNTFGDIALKAAISFGTGGTGTGAATFSDFNSVAF